MMGDRQDMGALSGSREPSPEVSALRAPIRSAGDTEIDAMHDAYLALSRVTPEGQLRALDWLEARLDWEQRTGAEAAQSVAKYARLVVRHKRKPAIAMEAATAGETERLDPKGDSAGPKDIAQGEGHD